MLLGLLLALGPAFGDEEGEAGKKEAPPAAPGEAMKLLADLQAANVAKDVAKVGSLCDPVAALGKTLKSGAEADLLAEELSKSLAFREEDLKEKVIKTLGELRSRKSSAGLKRVIGKKAKTEREEAIVGKAIEALAMAADPGDVDYLADFMKEQSLVVAKAAAGCFKGYQTAKAKTRKQIAEHLMKRLEGEYPSSGGQGGKVSAEQQKRWNELSSPLVSSLQAVCHQPTITDAAHWREWWKDNKKKPWRDSES